MGTYNLNISRHNFKQQRECYSITVKEIADICNLSPQTVINFEKGSGKYTDTMSRDYNSDMMIGTLRSLIEGKLDAMKMRQLEAITNNVKKEESIKKEKKYGGIYEETDIPREKVVEYIKAYCKHNKIPYTEFCAMCKINRMFTAPSSAKRDRYYITIGVLNKILNATGWTKEQILEGFKPEEKPAFNLKLVDKKEPDIPRHGDLVKKSDDTDVIAHNGGAKLADLNSTNRTITNVKYVCEDGKFYKEYDVITHMKLDISRDDFLKEVSGGGQS